MFTLGQGVAGRIVVTCESRGVSVGWSATGGGVCVCGILTWVSVTGAMVAGGVYGGVKSGSLQREQALLECVEPSLNPNRIGFA
jgi:hypothetical protein